LKDDEVMPDKYARFADLAAGEMAEVDYRICLIDRASPIAIIAPHGGEIEPGTSQISASIAADKFSLYCFEGHASGRPHRDLHITSAKFDEPQGRRMAEASEIVVGVHGRKDRDDKQTVWIGGRDETLRDAIGEALERAGFKAKTTGHSLPGAEPANICNCGRRKAGAQLEIPRRLRDKLVADAPLRQVFGAAVRGAIELHIAGANNL
jgi:phage replication-related protein YjqB (UPF0714/DUF867 family)